MNQWAYNWKQLNGFFVMSQFPLVATAINKNPKVEEARATQRSRDGRAANNLVHITAALARGAPVGL